MESSKDIVALGRTDISAPLVIGNRVVDRLLTSREIVDFPRKKYLFLQLRRRDVSVEDAALKLNMNLEEARNFNSSPAAQQYLEDRELAANLADEAQDPTRWWVRIEEINSGRMPVTREQMDAMKLAGARIAPTSENQGGPTRIEINIDPTAVQEAFRRQNAIEAQIIEERKAG